MTQFPHNHVLKIMRLLLFNKETEEYVNIYWRCTEN